MHPSPISTVAIASGRKSIEQERSSAKGISTNRRDFLAKGPDWQEKNECWEWLSNKNICGYGSVTWDWKVLSTHRVAYRLCRGPIPKGLLVRHTCDNRACVNPNHLLLGTVKDNVADRVRRGRSAAGDRSGMRLHPEKVKRGEENVTAKLTEKKVRQIREIFKNHGVNLAQVARDFGVAETTIRNVRNGNTWRHV